MSEGYFGNGSDKENLGCLAIGTAILLISLTVLWYGGAL
jgi:hypothetical protein